MSEETTRTKQLPVPGKDMDSIMENLETGVTVLFTSDRYQEYLRTMAKFHNYSFNNTLLIAHAAPRRNTCHQLQELAVYGKTGHERRKGNYDHCTGTL